MGRTKLNHNGHGLCVSITITSYSSIFMVYFYCNNNTYGVMAKVEVSA